MPPILPHRPSYHFIPPANWMNDPNGLIYWNGLYHLYYQHNPLAAKFGVMHWGHATSRDLVHWEHQPIALSPTPDGPDAEGCWSGCAVPLPDRPVFLYTGFTRQAQVACLAYAEGESLNRLVKYAKNPVIAAPPTGLKVEGFRDHTLWKEGDIWLMGIGSGITGAGGVIFIYRSQNLTEWEYLGTLTDGTERQRFPLYSGSMWECPGFFKLNNQWILMISVCDPYHPWHTAAFVGSYANHHFTPDSFEKVDYGNHTFYAPQTMEDQQGRRLMWGWIMEGRPVAQQVEAGWSGVMALPRQLSLSKEGYLLSEFIPELGLIRRTGTHLENWELEPTNDFDLGEYSGRSLELQIELKAVDSGQFILGLLRSPDGQEETRLVVDWTDRRILLDRQDSSLDEQVERDERVAPLPPTPRGTLRLHLYLDHSVLEVIANRRSALTSRAYPTRSDSVGMRIAARGHKMSVNVLDIWRLNGIW